MANHNFIQLTPDQASDVIYELLTSDYTRDSRILLIGDPGVGKSALLAQAARRMGAILIDIRLLQLDLGAMRGLERIITYPDGRVETVPTRPYFLPEYVPDDEINENTPRYIILLDEIMAADDAIRKCAFELLTDNRVGPHKIGKNVWVVAAGNSAEDGTIVHEMDRATRRRFTPIKIETSVEALLKHATKQNWHHGAIAFIRNNPGMISASDEDITNDNFCMPSPAGIENMSNALYAYEKKEIGRLAFEAKIKGSVGLAAAGELLQAIDDEESQFDLLNLLEAAPADRKYPGSSYGTYSLISALAAYTDTPEKLDRALDVVLGIPPETNDVVEECKAAYFFTIHDKLTAWGLFRKYAHDPRVGKFLAETRDITEEADREHAARQAEENESQQLQEAA